MVGKRILMTGGTGQVGETLLLGLAATHEIDCLARFTQPGAEERLASLGVRPVHGDYTGNRFDGLRDDYDYVLHLGALLDPSCADEGIVQNAEGTGFLLNHCRRARAFVYVSTTGVYWDNPDPYHRYVETDRLGGLSAHLPHYGISKLAGEAVVRTVGQMVGVPTTILRLNVSYGRGGNGGVPGQHLDKLIRGEPINLPDKWPTMHVPIHEDDLVASIEPAFEVAQLRSTILNWGGNDMVSYGEWVRYMAALIGVEPVFNRTSVRAAHSRAADPTKRDATIGPCRVNWRDGMRRMIRDRHPEIRLLDEPVAADG